MIRKLLFGLFLGVVAASCALPVFADSLDNWTKRIDGTNEELHAAAYGNNTFVVVGDNGTILSSPDGVAWTPRAGGTRGFLDVIYQKNIFAAVGAAGAIYTSVDGVTWTSQVSGIYRNLSGVAYGNDKFVAVAENESMMIGGSMVVPVVTTSQDGTTWTVPNTGITYGLEGVAFGNGKFVAVGYDPETMDEPDRVLTSLNGIDWTDNPISLVSDPYLNGVGFGNGLFVVVTYEGKIFTSPNGDDWTEQVSGTANILRKVAFGGDTFVVVGGDSDSYAVMLTSTNGEDWTNRINAATEGDTQLYGIGFGNNTFMAVGGYASGTIFQSDPLPNPTGDSGSLPVGPLAAGMSAFLVWWKRRRQRQI